MNLNKTFINSLTFDGVEKTYFDDVLKGFGVRVGKSSTSYIVMYRNVYGKQKKITIAKTTQIAPAQARDEAKKILALVVQGKDPASDKIEQVPDRPQAAHQSVFFRRVFGFRQKSDFTGFRKPLY